MVPRILVLAGTVDFGSPANRLADAGGLLLAQRGAEVTRISPLDYPLPLFDDGAEARPAPGQALRLAAMIDHHDGVLISSPALHAVMPPLLANLIAWTCRDCPERPRKQPWRDRVVAIVAAAGHQEDAGLVAGQLRAMLDRLGSDVIAAQCCIGNAADAFDESGWLTDMQDRRNLDNTCLQLYERSQVFRKYTRPA